MCCITQNLHQSQLRPSLGHPHNRTEMDTLCSSEERRRQEALDGAKQHAEALAVSHHNPAKQIGPSRGELAKFISCSALLRRIQYLFGLDFRRSLGIGRVPPREESFRGVTAGS